MSESDDVWPHRHDAVRPSSSNPHPTRRRPHRHDADHRGRNNAWHVQVHDELAIRYNDESVLENHHCAVGFGLTATCDLFANTSKSAFKDIRKMVIALVLVTDLGSHLNTLARRLLLSRTPTNIFYEILEKMRKTES